MAVKIRPKVSYCIGCKREYAVDRFMSYSVSSDNFTNGYLPFCETCCEDLLKYNIKQVGTLQGAFYYTCAKLDIPFCKKPYEAMLKMKDSYQARSTKSGGVAKADTEYNLFHWYYDFLWGKSSMQKPTDLWMNFSSSDTKIDDVVGIKAMEELEMQMDEYKLNWNEQDTIQDYQFLSYCFEKYTKGITIETPVQEDLYRDLCLARLDKRKIQEGRSSEDITKVQARILNLMKVLKLDDFESNKAKSLSEQFLSNRILMMNENDVEDIYKEQDTKYKDYNKLQMYMKDMVLRPLGNMLAGNRDFSINIEDIERYQIE